MSIEQDAAKDLSVSDAEAENVTGGKKKAAPKATKHAAKTYPVGYVNVQPTPGTTVDSSGTTAWGDDCDDSSGF